MARQESDRHDLFAELAALRPRVELRVGDDAEIVCAGRRESTGGWSLFLGPDQVYHLDAQSRLRRAFVDGFLYRSEGTTLSRLRRERSPGETSLLRHDLTDEELARFLADMQAAIGIFLGEIRGHRVEVLRVEPEGQEILPQLLAVFEAALAVHPPLAPAIRG